MTRRPKEQEHKHDGIEMTTWFRILDIVVWTAVVIIAALAAEWLFGTVARARMTSAAEKLTRSAAESSPS